MPIDVLAGRFAAVAAFVALLAGFWWLAGDPADAGREDYGARYGALMARTGRPICIGSAVISAVAFVVWLAA